MSTRKLMFVYNADSGLFSSLTDFAHKILSPSTYNCRLCLLTYGNFTVKQEWQSFIQSLPVESTFLHRDEFSKNYNITEQLPAIFFEQAGSAVLFISKAKIEQCNTVDDLKELILSELQA